MCDSCRLDCIAYYGDDAIWKRAQELYHDNANLGVLGHIVFEDDNLELHHLYWSKSQLTDALCDRSNRKNERRRTSDLADYSDAEIREAIGAHDELINMAEAVFGMDKAEDRVAELRRA